MMIEKDGIKLLSKYRSAIMGVAALLILFFHEWIVLFQDVAVIGKVEGFVKRAGFCGVDIFFLLSGIGLTYAITKSKLPMFYYKRIKRIIIPFLFVAILRYYSEHWLLKDFFGNISGYNFYTKSMYSFLWFVPAILTLYLLFPLYYKLFSMSKNKAVFTLCVLIIWLLVSMMQKGLIREDLFGFTNRIPVFVVGVLIGYLQKNRKFDFTKLSWFAILLILVLGVYLSYQTNFYGMPLLVPVANCCIPNLLMAFSFSCLLAKFLEILERRVKPVGNVFVKVFSFFGMFSLEFYCFQEYLGGKIIPVMTGRYSNGVINLAVFACVTVAALLLFLLSKYIFVGIEFLFSKLFTAEKSALSDSNKNTAHSSPKTHKKAE